MIDNNKIEKDVDKLIDYIDNDINKKDTQLEENNENRDGCGILTQEEIDILLNAIFGEKNDSSNKDTNK